MLLVLSELFVANVLMLLVLSELFVANVLMLLVLLESLVANVVCCSVAPVVIVVNVMNDITLTYILTIILIFFKSNITFLYNLHHFVVNVHDVQCNRMNHFVKCFAYIICQSAYTAYIICYVVVAFFLLPCTTLPCAALLVQCCTCSCVCQTNICNSLSRAYYLLCN